jgi:hypothetical protein
MGNNLKPKQPQSNLNPTTDEGPKTALDFGIRIFENINFFN